MSHVTLGGRLDDAFKYAREVHATQSRKGADTPYLGHLLGVASIITVIQRFAYVYQAANGVDGGERVGEPVRARPRERAAALDPLATGR